MKYEIQELEELLKYLAKAISNRSDAAVYIPIFERVEQELETRRRGLSTLERIKTLKAGESSESRVFSLAA